MKMIRVEECGADMNKKYRNAISEVIAVLKYYLKPEELEKIPQEKIKWLYENANKNYCFEIDEKKPLEEQNLSQEANTIIVSIYREYFLDKEKIPILDKILELNELKEKVRKKYKKE